MKCVVCKKNKIPLWKWLLFLGNPICRECDLIIKVLLYAKDLFMEKILKNE